MIAGGRDDVGTVEPGSTPATKVGAIDDAAGRVFAGPGEMRALCRAFDWASTSLGPVAAWSNSLRTIVGIVLASRNPMFIWWGPDLIQVYNDAYRPSLGLGARHPGALGARGKGFWTEIWDTIGPQIEHVMSGGEATWHEDQYIPIERNGRLEDVWWTYGYSAVRDDDGRIGGTLVVCQETTKRVIATRELKELLAETARAEHRAAEVLEQIGDQHLTLDADFCILTVNAAALRNLGTSREALIGKTHWEAFPASAGTAVEHEYRRVARERVESHFTHHYVGEGRDFRAEIDAYPTDEGGVAVFWRDVTERHRAELALRESEGRYRTLLAESETARLESETARSEAETARAEAEAANRVKGEFLAVMSHELRTPLNAIGGYAELMEMGIRGPVTAQQSEDLRRIQASQRHLLGLINEVLNYAKLETGVVHYDIREVHVAQAVASAEALVAPQARAKGLDLEATCAPRDLSVRADPDKLQQIVVNLLSNSVKFTDRGGRVSVSCDSSGDVVSIRVRDSGIGIPADKLALIFDPFVQVRSDLTRLHEGTGLGLAISRDLAVGMGGDLTVTSIMGSGSTFILTLPAR